ncbi:uncharacterized protein METZ01_LOCUS11359, partial [marine metagenome]
VVPTDKIPHRNTGLQQVSHPVVALTAAADCG